MRTVRAIAATASLLTASPVHAQTPGKVATPRAPAPASEGKPAGVPGEDAKSQATALFDEAVALASAGNYPEACAKLEASLALYDAAGTSFHLAGCWAKIGRTASAYDLFQKVAQRTQQAGQTERAEAARARLEALAPKLSRLRIDIDPKTRPPRLEIKSNGAVVPEAEWGKSMPVDRGTYEISATAESKQPWSRRVEVTEPGVTYGLLVPELQDAAPPAAAAPPPKPAQPAKARPAGKPAEGGAGRTVLTYTLGGVGVAGLVAGGLLGLRYKDKNDQAKEVCPASVGCSPAEIEQHASLVDDAKQARTWAVVSAGIGAAAFATAGYLFFSAPRRPDREAAIWAEPVVSASGSLGAALNGRF